MDVSQIGITAEPTDHTRCRFVVSEPVYAGGVRRFTSAAEAQESPLARGIFALPGLGVTEVVAAGNVVTVVKESPAPWNAVGRLVGQTIRAAFAEGEGGGGPVPAPEAPTPRAGAPSDDQLYDRVATLFDQEVNPMVARHGGRVELIDVQDATVMVRMAGGCQGCGMADVTLRQGIEGLLARFIPEVKGVVDITDHAAGENPYFQAAKK
ncbi:MAG: NifU family protein [Gemmatimonadales bacterium]